MPRTAIHLLQIVYFYFFEILWILCFSKSAPDMVSENRLELVSGTSEKKSSPILKTLFSSWIKSS